MKTVLIAAIVNILWVIWHCRNKVRFCNQSVHPSLTKNLVVASTSLTGNLTTGHMFSTVNELSILKLFRVSGHSAKDPDIAQVDWLPPPCGWIKANIDWATKGSPGHASGGHF